MIIVAFVDIENRQNQLVFILDQLLKKLYIIRISEIEASQHVHLIHQVLLPLWQRALRPLEVGAERLREWGQLVGEFDISDHPVDVGVK